MASSSANRPVVDNAYKRSIYDLLSLKKKTILITGGGRGIGLALARGCVEAGGNVAILDALERPHEDYEGMKKEFPESKMEYYRADVTNLPKLTEVFERLLQDFGTIEGCITAAGIVLDKPFENHQYDETLRVTMVNVLGTFFSAQLCTQHFLSRKYPGSIVFIASIAASHSLPSQTLSAYSASKGAVKSLMQELAVELGPRGIRVNSISPGFTHTDMTANLAKTNPELVKAFENAPPLERMGNRRDLKLAVVGLLGDGGAYTTGTDVSITGGLHLGKM